MASEDRPTAHDLSQAWLRDLDLKRAGLFAVLRQLEARSASRPRIGRARRPGQERLRLGQVPELDFAPAALARLDRSRAGVPCLGVRFFGLLGPQGPMPLHLTEFVRERQHQHGDPGRRRCGGAA